ncbi:hypothetical protein C7B80_32340 [Cyanosarcina cf. burmensis CCALA 770]|nr:hypothetical protein C7B80_32340 [Cyanosarcina cf. burmensis CCALA 770]
MYTLGTAAKATGKSKTSILRALQSGRLSYVEKTENGYQIEPSELQRVFRIVPPGTSHQPNPVERSVTVEGHRLTPEAVRIRELEIRLEVALESAAQMKQASEQRMREIQDDRDHWRRQATALLEDKRPRQQGLWGRVTGWK